MRYVAFLCGLVLILACNAGAQVNPGTSFLLSSPAPAWAAAAPPLSAPAASPQGVYGVLQSYNCKRMPVTRFSASTRYPASPAT